MTAKLVSILIYASIQTILSEQFFQTAHLKPSSSSTVSGITVDTGPGATVINDQWNINVISQQGSDLNIAMDSRWGFHPLFLSSIQLYIQGATSNETYQTDGEILFVASVDDQYFAEMISIDERKSSYKECPNSHDALITRDVIEMISGSQPDRYHRFCKNPIGTPHTKASDNWDNVGTATSYKQPAQWPMWITITNDPTSNTVSYGWSDALNGFNKITSQYASSFGTNQGMNIFISGESPNEDFVIFSVDITYRYEVVTPNPTPIPTPQPTDNPTLKPTRNPTTSLPTVSPTMKPTVSPTPKPTASPTTAPTWSPTIVGETRAPTITQSPTHTPTEVPTTQDDVPPLTVTEVVNFTPTKIMVVKVGKEGAISWFQAMIIIVAVFVFIVAWVGFCAFVFFVKRKSKSKKQKLKRKPSNSEDQSPGEEDRIDHHETVPGRIQPVYNMKYKSESAMMAHDKTAIHEHIPDFLNIKMPQEFEDGYVQQNALHSGYVHRPHSITPHGSRALSPNHGGLNPLHIRQVHSQYSETSVGVSETDELSRHDMIYIPGKQTQYREKYRRSMMAQQRNKQYSRYKGYQVSQSIDI